MNNRSSIELARNYVTLSNNHKLDQIKPLFAADATYHSAFFGGFQGVDAIYAMMTGFFTRFPDACWEVAAYEAIENNGVAFTFIMAGTDTATGERVRRHGLERIYFTAEGLIQHIEVGKPEE